MRAAGVPGAGTVTSDRADIYARIATCEPADCEAVAAFLRDSPFVAAESVQPVPESHRVLYAIDELRVPREDIQCADRAVQYGVAAVVSAHRYVAP